MEVVALDSNITDGSHTEPGETVRVAHLPSGAPRAAYRAAIDATPDEMRAPSLVGSFRAGYCVGIMGLPAPHVSVDDAIADTAKGVTPPPNTNGGRKNSALERAMLSARIVGHRTGAFDRERGIRPTRRDVLLGRAPDARRRDAASATLLAASDEFEGSALVAAKDVAPVFLTNGPFVGMHVARVHVRRALAITDYRSAYKRPSVVGIEARRRCGERCSTAYVHALDRVAQGEDIPRIISALRITGHFPTVAVYIAAHRDDAVNACRFADVACVHWDASDPTMIPRQDAIDCADWLVVDVVTPADVGRAVDALAGYDLPPRLVVALRHPPSTPTVTGAAKLAAISQGWRVLPI